MRAAFFAAEGHLRLGDTAAAESLYKKVESWGGPEHLEPFRMVAATRVGEIKARAGRYRSAARWYDRAVEHHRGVYRVDWMLQGRARRFTELSEGGGVLSENQVLFATP